HSGTERDGEAQAHEDEGRRAEEGFRQGSNGPGEVRAAATSQRLADSPGIADRAGEHRPVAVEDPRSRAADRSDWIRPDQLEVINVGQDDDDRAHAERGDEREHGNERATKHPSHVPTIATSAAALSNRNAAL